MKKIEEIIESFKDNFSDNFIMEEAEIWLKSDMKELIKNEREIIKNSIKKLQQNKQHSLKLKSFKGLGPEEKNGIRAEHFGYNKAIKEVLKILTSNK